MIINWSHNFIFMHSRKTAGSTITAALNRYLGPDDIQIGAWPDTISSGGWMNRTAKRIAFRKPSVTALRSFKQSIKQRRPMLSPHAVNEAIRLHFREEGLKAGTHSSANDVRDYVPEFWNSAFKFGFVRNPWTHAVSDYHWRCHAQSTNAVDFKEFLYRLADPKRPDPQRIRSPVVTNWSIYTIDDRIALDHVARYENLSDELSDIGRRLGIAIDIGGISSKGKVRDRSKSIASYYDAENLDLVGQIYQKEVDAFGYEPPV